MSSEYGIKCQAHERSELEHNQLRVQQSRKHMYSPQSQNKYQQEAKSSVRNILAYKVPLMDKWCFDRSNAIEIWNGIIFNFYTGLPHFPFILFCSILGYIPSSSILHTALLLLCNGPWAYSVIQYVPKDCMSPSLDTFCGICAVFTFSMHSTEVQNPQR